MTLKLSDVISILALFISMISLAISWFFNFRDKADLKIIGKFFVSHPDYDRAHINVKVVNSGRRPMILTLFGGDLKGGGYCGTSLGKDHKGLRLDEHESYETKVYVEDLDY